MPDPDLPIPEDAPPFPDDALDEYLDPARLEGVSGPLPVPEFDRLRQFEPTNDVEAEKVMRRLVAAYRRKRQLLDQYAELVEPINRWLDESLAPWERRIAWLTDHLKLYAIKRRARLGEKDPAAKTLRLPSGVVPTRRTERRVDVIDPDAFLQWAKQHRPDLIRYPDPPPPAPAKNDIKKAAIIVEKNDDLLPIIDGEIVPGLVAYDVQVDADPKPNLHD